MALATGTLSADEATLAIPINSEHDSEAVIQVAGTFVATLLVEASLDGTNYETLEITPVGGGAAVTSITAPGAWRVDLGGWKSAQVRVDTFTSGDAAVSASTVRAAA